jgi:hypothetical protein
VRRDVVPTVLRQQHMVLQRAVLCCAADRRSACATGAEHMAGLYVRALSGSDAAIASASCLFV